MFRLSHDDLAAMIAGGAKWAEIGREAGVRSTYAQAVWASIQDNYPGVKYAHGKGRGRSGHPVTDQDKNTVLLFRQGHITRAQAYDRLTACGRTRGGAKQILNKHSHTNLESLTASTQRPRALSNASLASTSSSVGTSYGHHHSMTTPPPSSSHDSSIESSPESENEPITPVTPVSLPISSLLQPEPPRRMDEEPPKLREHAQPAGTGLGLRLSHVTPSYQGYQSYQPMGYWPQQSTFQSSNILPPISTDRIVQDK